MAKTLWQKDGLILVDDATGLPYFCAPENPPPCCGPTPTPTPTGPTPTPTPTGPTPTPTPTGPTPTPTPFTEPGYYCKHVFQYTYEETCDGTPYVDGYTCSNIPDPTIYPYCADAGGHLEYYVLESGPYDTLEECEAAGCGS